jgi:hypothetical protein
MPRLGEPLEPTRVERVEPWWRPIAALEARNQGKVVEGVDTSPSTPALMSARLTEGPWD